MAKINTTRYDVTEDLRPPEEMPACRAKACTRPFPENKPPASIPFSKVIKAPGLKLHAEVTALARQGAPADARIPRGWAWPLIPCHCQTKTKEGTK